MCMHFCCIFNIFFFSSRRRHTRWTGDWSSDVCSSDLPPPSEFAAQANAQPSIYDEDFETFWEREGRERVAWFEPFTKLYEWEPPYAKWYLGGKLNVAWNCLDKHVEAGRGDTVAYHWEGEPDGERRDLTYAELLAEVTKLANALRSLGVRKGTPVGIYMGMVPE